ncbi:division plane positioning ATPase MipZ [Aliarcobacter cryaerophilus]|uniref:nucleotide-binding protein n=1 Tax=Aliarcobacter cryaerophilus TaxID=28198 RepID=UPI003DA490C4
MKYIVVTNHKGGASKSTTTMQICGAYALYKNMNVEIFEFDDENKDSQNFTKSKIKSTQVEVGDGSEITTTLRNLFNGIDKADMRLCDVGGNKTTTIFLEGLKKSRMFKKVDLFIIPMSGGSQDLKNAKKTLDVILEMDKNANIMFCLSRVRNPRRVQFQYGDFFNDKDLKKYPYIILKDSDVIDLSRKIKKSVYELATDLESKNEIEDAFDIALDEEDNQKISNLSVMLEIYDEAENYLQTTLNVAFDQLDKLLYGELK